ncbi:tyrosine-type recombinase/integrase [Streptomyces sp. XY66]|uniref:tyrosine-type recombinase/integrase n=1 Tax=Streptomyces sp. XY66 TaxID=1415563 RepID=UPI000AE018FA
MKTLPRGMGTVFKRCNHSSDEWSRCQHPYVIRYRSLSGRQTEQGGFRTQTKAVSRLSEIHAAKYQASSSSDFRQERADRYGRMTFKEYAEQWRLGQRHLAPSSARHLDSLLKHHIFPVLGSRRMNSFDHRVVDDFIRTLEVADTGLATQSNAFDKLSAVLTDAQRLGIYDFNPTDGVKPPQYTPGRATIPTVERLRNIRQIGDDRLRLICDLMSGCGMRNSEAVAVNIDNIVADNVYRITEQVNQATKDYDRLKHRKSGEYREVPLPPRIRQSIEQYAAEHGSTDGYLVRDPRDSSRPFQPYLLQNQWQRLKRANRADMPDGMVLYSLRHFFASRCLQLRIPITDVADWMGHKSLDMTFRIYRHLMPGSIKSAAESLDFALVA